MIELLALPICAACVLALRRHARREAVRRARMLGPCAVLVEEPVAGRDRAGYATLDGRFEGLAVAVRLIPESVAFRRLPQLWLSVTVHHATGAAASLDILRRPTGAEFYAPGDAMPARYPVPAGWPGETQVRGSHGAESLLARAAVPVATVVAEPRVKEVLITPRGVRILAQVCEGERGAYLLLRDLRFRLDAVAPGRLLPLLLQASDLARGLAAGDVASNDLVPEDVDARDAA